MYYYIGGGNLPANAGGTGNVLIDTLSQLPILMKVLNAQNEALNGRPVTEEARDISKAIGAGLEALGKKDESNPTSVPEPISEEK